MPKTITRDELITLLAGTNPPVLVEALPEKYFRDRHLPGAINIPHDRIDELARSLLPDKNHPVVVYCANGPCRNSGIAAARLADLGYGDVRDYHEGKADWIAAGLPVERGNRAAEAA
jgi:rhodanese-related sulfurtransferase